MRGCCSGQIQIVDGPGISRPVSEAVVGTLHNEIVSQITGKRDLSTIFDLYSAIDGEGTPKQLAKAGEIYSREKAQARELIATALGESWDPPQQQTAAPLEQQRLAA
jgi:hypothetical protein